MMEPNPIDFDKLATKKDLAALESRICAKFDRLHANVDQIHSSLNPVDSQILRTQAALELRMAQQLRLILMSQAATAAIVAGIIATA